MKQKQLARTFLKVGKIINIILLPVFAVLLVVFIIIDSVAIAAAVADGNDAAIAAASSALGSAIFGYTFTIVCLIVALILNSRASAILERAKSKAEARPGAIMAIVAGALVTLFPIASGVLMLVMKEEDWSAREEEPRE